jgi:hypothetical protein
MTQTQIRESRFLEWQYDHGGDADIAAFQGEVADDGDGAGWRLVIRAAATDGYVVLHESLATTTGAVVLLPRGRVRVELLRERRVDAHLRRPGSGRCGCA